MDIDFCNDNQCIKNISSVKKNNEIILNWDWPDLNTKIDYVCIFELEKEDETLDDLITRNAKHFSVSRKNYMENGCYRKTLLYDNVCYKVFPVKTNASNTVILNQLSFNTTKIFYKSIVIEYSIKEKNVNNKKRIYFLFTNVDNILNIDNNEIVYNKYDKNNKYICSYPVSIDLIMKNEYNILINKSEQVRLGLKDKESDVLKFYLKC